MEPTDHTMAGQNYSSDFKKIMDAAEEINPLFRQLVQEVIVTHNTVLEISLFIAGIKENTIMTRDQLDSSADLFRKMAIPSLNASMIQSYLSGNKQHPINLSGLSNANQLDLIERIKSAGWTVDIIEEKDQNFKIIIS